MSPVCTCVCVYARAPEPVCAGGGGAQGPRIRWPRQKPRLTFLREGIFSVSCLPASCFPFFSGTSFPCLWLEALKIPPKYVPKENASTAKRLWDTEELDGGGLCVSFNGGWKKGRGEGGAEISGGTNQPLRVGRTPSLDAGQRSSPFSLRPQHQVWRLPRDRESCDMS